jgi:hypothetical protein
MVIDREELKIEPDEDDGMSVLSLAKHIEEDNERKKNQLANDFEEMGGQFLKEIDKKKKRKWSKKSKLIPYILKHRGEDYDRDELMSYEYDDVLDIYNETKKEKRPFFIKIFHFIFNIE